MIPLVHNLGSANDSHSEPEESNTAPKIIAVIQDDSKQKSSYEHGSDFERLRSSGHFLIPVHAHM